jgi:hypothetical protein
VRTGGRYPGGGERSWLLIKHRDDWAGDVDITEFAPKSVKSDGDFPDILAQDNPEIWESNRPAKGGETGAMFEKIVARALEMKTGKKAAPRATATSTKSTKVTKVTETTKRVSSRTKKR